MKELPFCNPILDSSVLMLYKTPSYRISLLDVKLIKLPTYESADELEDLDASAAIVAAAALLVEREIEQRTPTTSSRREKRLESRSRGERKGNIGFLWSDVGFPIFTFLFFENRGFRFFYLYSNTNFFLLEKRFENKRLFQLSNQIKLMLRENEHISRKAKINN